MGNCTSSRRKRPEVNSLKDDLLLAEAAIQLGGKELSIANEHLEAYRIALEARYQEVATLQSDLKELQESNDTLGSGSTQPSLQLTLAQKELATCQQDLAARRANHEALEKYLTKTQTDNDKIRLVKNEHIDALEAGLRTMKDKLEAQLETNRLNVESEDAIERLMSTTVKELQNLASKTIELSKTATSGGSEQKDDTETLSGSILVEIKEAK